MTFSELPGIFQVFQAPNEIPGIFKVFQANLHQFSRLLLYAYMVISTKFIINTYIFIIKCKSALQNLHFKPRYLQNSSAMCFHRGTVFMPSGWLLA